jgi:hypothetical protein
MQYASKATTSPLQFKHFPHWSSHRTLLQTVMVENHSATSLLICRSSFLRRAQLLLEMPPVCIITLHGSPVRCFRYLRNPRAIAQRRFGNRLRQRSCPVSIQFSMPIAIPPHRSIHGRVRGSSIDSTGPHAVVGRMTAADTRFNPASIRKAAKPSVDQRVAAAGRW